MSKLDTLTKENIIKDCLAVERSVGMVSIPYRCFTIFLFLLIACFCWLAYLDWVMIFPIGYILYQFVRLVMAIVRTVKRRRMIQNGDFIVSTDTLKYIAEETILEPHLTGSRAWLTREVKKLHFASLSWRVAPIMYYTWSEEYYRSPGILTMSSMEGDEFYLILDKKTNEVLCVYNRKFFDGEALMKQ